MLLEQEDGRLLAGPLDMMCILHNVHNHRYHVAFFEEHPCGSITDVEHTDVVRLRSKMHHTAGADTLEGALVHLAEMRQKITIDDKNVITTPIGWDGEIGITWIASNWLRDGTDAAQALGYRTKEI